MANDSNSAFEAFTEAVIESSKQRIRERFGLSPSSDPPVYVELTTPDGSRWRTIPTPSGKLIDWERVV